MIKNRRIRMSLMSGSAVALLAAPMAANAQSVAAVDQSQPVSTEDQSGQPLPVNDDEAAAPEIVVTGTNISGVKPVGSKVISIDRKTIEATGFSTPADVVRTLPQVSNLGQFHEGGGTYNNNNGQQASAINLRGLGTQATLTLIDGRRTTVSGSGVNFTDANVVPGVALERIEVVTDGASAIYGTDAVGGVVNYIIRKDFDGVEASMRIGNTQGGFELTPSLTLGKKWENGLGAGNFLLSYQFSHRDRYRNSESPFLRQDLRSLGGPDRRLTQNNATAGYPGNIVVQNPGNAANPTIPLAGPYTYYGLPNGTNVGLTPASLALNQPNLLDASDYSDYIGTRKQHQVVAFFNQDLGPRVSVYGEVVYSDVNTSVDTLNNTIQRVTLAPFLYNAAGAVTAAPNPYYISGIPNVAAGARETVQYNAYKDVGASPFTTFSNTVFATGGVKVKIGSGWTGEAYYTIARNHACNGCQYNLVNNSALQYQIDLGNVNPLSAAPVSASTVASFVGLNEAISWNGSDDAVVKFNGPLFSLPAGKVRLAFGGEYNSIFNENFNHSNGGQFNVLTTQTTRKSTHSSRNVKAFFAELYVPLVADDMDVPLVKALTFDGAIRNDRYSDVGNTTNPRLGLTWDVNDALRFRGTWGTSFRAPTLVDTNPNAISYADNGTVTNTRDSRITNGANPALNQAKYAQLYDANPDIKPETASTWSVGADLSLFDNSVRFSGSYYNVVYKDRIARPNVRGAFANTALSAPDYGGYGQFIIPINNPSTCSNSNPASADPALQKYLNLPILYDYGFRPDFCSINVVFDLRNTNLATTKQDGIDAQIEVSQTLGDVNLSLNGAVTRILHNKVQTGPGAPVSTQLGTYDTPLKWRGRGSLHADWRSFDTTLFMNYTGSYTNPYHVDNNLVTTASTKVGAYVTFDLNLTWRAPIERTDGVIKGLRLSATVQNLFDRDPTYSLVGSSAFNTTYNNPFGRTYMLQVTSDF